MIPPAPYQIVGSEFLAARRFALLGDEMRVRKSRQAIMAAEKLDLKSIIVVCPAIAIAHWRAEFQRWWPTCTADVEVISYDRLRRSERKEVLKHRDLAIVDECHFAKNPEAKRTKMVYGKGGLGWVCDRLWALSGTPAPKHAGELWPMMKAFGVEPLDYDQFINRYCVINSFTLQIKGTKTEMIPELKEKLKTIMLRRTRKEVAPDMPAIDFQFLEVDPRPNVKVDLNAGSGMTDEQLEAWITANAATDTSNRKDVALAKAENLIEIVDFTLDNHLLAQTVVFGWHKEPLQRVCWGLTARGHRAALLTGDSTQSQRERVQVDFREGRIQVICANILAAGTAIDLSAASHGYFLELDYVNGNNLQAANRLVSLDKAEPVTFDVLTWKGTTDDRVQQILVRRANELSQLY